MRSMLLGLGIQATCGSYIYAQAHTLHFFCLKNTLRACAHTLTLSSFFFPFLSAPKTLQSAAAGGLYNLVTAADREGEKFRII